MKLQGKVGEKDWYNNIKGQVTAIVKSQTAVLKKHKEAETADLNENATVISSFAKDQWSHNPLEANVKSPETDAVSEDLNINAIFKKRQSDPWRNPIILCHVMLGLTAWYQMNIWWFGS